MNKIQTMKEHDYLTCGTAHHRYSPCPLHVGRHNTDHNPS